MDQREKINDFEETLRVAISGMLLDVSTCMPVQVVNWDATEMTCTVQPLLQTRVQASDGSYAWINQAVLIHAPIIFFGGAGFTITAPPKPGTEALAIFSHRAIDNWWLAGGIQKRNDLRAHSMSDGFILVGPRSKPNVLANINPDAMEIRSDDATVKISLALSGVTTTAPSIVAKSSGGTAMPVMTQAFYQWFITNILPFLRSLPEPYGGPNPPTNSETTVLLAE